MIRIMKQANIKTIVTRPGLINWNVRDVSKSQDIENGHIQSSKFLEEYNIALIDLTRMKMYPLLIFIKVFQALLNPRMKFGKSI